MNYSAKKISLLLLLILSIVFIPIGRSVAIEIDAMDSDSSRCYGCEGSTEQVKDHCVEKGCGFDSCIGSGSVTLYFSAPVLVYSLVRAKTLVYWNSSQFQSQFTAPLYRPPIA